LVEWFRDGQQAVVGTVVRVERSAPRLPGSVMAVSSSGTVAGSVTGGCVEPAVFLQAQEVLDGGPARLASFGFSDGDAFEVGLPCGGTVDIFIEPLDADLVAQIAAAVAEERSVAYVTTIAGPELGNPRVIGRDGPADDIEAAARRLLARGENGAIEVGDQRIFVSSFVPRPAMYVFGAIDFASALSTVGHFLGYRVTVCDPRAMFLTPARFPDADALVTEWPHEFLGHAPVDERTAICVLTHDDKFDVPALRAALETPAGFIGAMGSRRTTERRRTRLIEMGVSEEALTRIHAPIGLKINSQTPEEVAISIAAQIVAVTNEREGREARARV
jgi:xanthine dehydrogenase accessory factor